MKLTSYITIVLLAISLSCSEEETLVDQIASSSNLVGFHTATQALSGIANGTEYDFQIPVKVFGPSVKSLDGSINVVVSVNESSTAVEGTHFQLDSKQITLSEDGDFLGAL